MDDKTFRETLIESGIASRLTLGTLAPKAHSVGYLVQKYQEVVAELRRAGVTKEPPKD